MNQTIYAYISDGGVQEEISQGAGRIAGALGLDNLIMFYDANDIQLSTETKDVTIEDTAKNTKHGAGKLSKSTVTMPMLFVARSMKLKQKRNVPH